jgi:hypothetical protein
MIGLPLWGEPPILNSKIQAPNHKQAPKSNDRNAEKKIERAFVSDIGIWNLEFI